MLTDLRVGDHQQLAASDIFGLAEAGEDRRAGGVGQSIPLAEIGAVRGSWNT
jgi:hypothetical protein